ncbi:MAG: YicC family protein [Bacteroidales bacterium]|nr:YicC family protein [Bacteroidales bacterium]
MKSMTGYAKRQYSIGGRTISIELKTLNSKQLDLNVKLPNAYRGHELEIRSLLNRLERGKADLTITEENDNTSVVGLNEELLHNRIVALQRMAQSLNQQTDRLLESLVTMNDVWSTNNGEEDEATWPMLRQAVEQTIADCDTFRAHEGAILQNDICKHVDAIEQRLHLIPQYEAERIETVKERMHKYLSDLQLESVDSNRFEQELAYYLEKLDITEEKVRLAKHIDYFRHTVKEESTCGKKLSFICQEMGREINTTGSKANHVEMQRLVVEMKDELEKIKEQLGNIL